VDLGGQGLVTYIVQRLLQGIPVLLGVTFLVFAAMHLTPGNPARVMVAEFGATPEDIRQLERELGLDRHWLVQYRDFLFAALQGDLGQSLFTKRPVVEQIRLALPSTLILTTGAIITSLAIGIPLGIVSALRRGTWIDVTSMVVALLGVSMPVFWTSLVLILLFSIVLGWLPATGGEGVRALIMPTLALGVVSAGLNARLVRSSMLEVLRAEYITTARAKGIAEYAVIIRHALRNALIPLVTIVGLQIGNLLSAAVIVETIFGRPGLGSMLIRAVLRKDFPLVQGTVLFIAVAYIVINIAVDVLYGLIDPRIRHDSGA
jgi:peptide/nickel transport system permease protein